MDFDNPKVYGDTFISDGLVFVRGGAEENFFWLGRSGAALNIFGVGAGRGVHP